MGSIKRGASDDYAWTRTAEYAREFARLSHKRALDDPVPDTGTNAYALMLLERSTHERLLDPCDD